jgi:CelD/BcsL family acetyltransferase involved in cellulose biosynthesis
VSTGGSGLRFELIEPAQLDGGLRATWDSIRTAEDHLASPFFSPDFVAAVGRVRDDVRIAVISDGSRVVGVFPFQRRGRAGRAIGHGVSDWQGLIARADLAIDRTTLLRGCQLDTLSMDHMIQEDARRLAPGARGEDSWYMDLSLGYETYLAGRRAASPGHFKSLSRKRNKLWRDHQVDMVLEDGDEAFALLLSWKAAQYRRTGRRDRFSQPWIVGLLEELRHTAAPGCRGLVSTLRVDGQVAAVHLGIASERVLACWFPAFSAEHGAASPGQQLFLLLAEAAPAMGITKLDMGKGAEAFKQVLCDRSETATECDLMVPSLTAARHAVTHLSTKRVERFVLDHPRLRVAARRTLKAAGRLRSPRS